MEKTNNWRCERRPGRSVWPLAELLLVLGVVFGTSVLHGLRAEPLSLAGYQLARPDLGEWVAAPSFEPPTAAKGKPVPGATSAVVEQQAPTPSNVLALGPGKLPRSGSELGPLDADQAPRKLHRVLMLGDSMIEPLQQRAAAYFEQAGHKFISIIWYGSRTVDWGSGTRLSRALQVYAPSYVVVVLGSNELLARDLERRASRVRAMLRTLGELPVVWVGPPSWRDDHGFNAMLAKELGEHFFHSDQLTFERKSDGIHPTDTSGAVWMDRVAEWMHTRPDQTRLELPVPERTTGHHAPARVWPPPNQ